MKGPIQCLEYFHSYCPPGPPGRTPLPAPFFSLFPPSPSSSCFSFFSPFTSTATSFASHSLSLPPPPYLNKTGIQFCTKKIIVLEACLVETKNCVKFFPLYKRKGLGALDLRILPSGRAGAKKEDIMHIKDKGSLRVTLLGFVRRHKKQDK